MVFNGDAGEVSFAILDVVEEVSHSLGQHLMVVGDEALLGAIDKFAAAQGAGWEAAENVEKEIVCEAGHCVPLVGDRLHFKGPTIIIV